jgi:hypothetical protein
VLQTKKQKPKTIGMEEKATAEARGNGQKKMKVFGVPQRFPKSQNEKKKGVSWPAARPLRLIALQFA